MPIALAAVMLLTGNLTVLTAVTGILVFNLIRVRLSRRRMVYAT